MDEVIFRSSQKLENMQIQAELAATKTKDAFVLYSQQMKLYLEVLWNNATADQLKASMRVFYIKIISAAKMLQTRVIHFANPQHLYQALLKALGKKLTRRDVYFGCAGFLLGGIVGIAIGLSYRRRDSGLRYMQAIQCRNDLGAEFVTVVEDALAPFECGEYEVLVNVKAASVQIIDVQICNGYGKTLRRILQKIYKQSNSNARVILGRDCTGIITDIGSKVTRMEVGDEVWLAVPFWSQGTLCQTVLVSENRASRKPKSIGFEGACSLPYAGSLALSALDEAKVDMCNAKDKKILILGGCTPVGCVLIQLLNYWKAIVTTTCYKRAIPVVRALGVTNIVTLSEPLISPDNKSFVESEYQQLLRNTLLKELEVRANIYDAIIITSNECNVTIENLSNFCKPDGDIISTLPPALSSDSCSFFTSSMLSLYINIKTKIQRILRIPTTHDFDETHLCYVTLDKLQEFVEDGCLQTVVDKVYPPQDIEIAINHILSSQSIGSTIVTFR